MADIVLIYQHVLSEIRDHKYIPLRRLHAYNDEKMTRLYRCVTSFQTVEELHGCSKHIKTKKDLYWVVIVPGLLKCVRTYNDVRNRCAEEFKKQTVRSMVAYCLCIKKIFGIRIPTDIVYEIQTHLLFCNAVVNGEKIIKRPNW